MRVCMRMLRVACVCIRTRVCVHLKEYASRNYFVWRARVYVCVYVCMYARVHIPSVSAYECACVYVWMCEYKHVFLFMFEYKNTLAHNSHDRCVREYSCVCSICVHIHCV